MNESKSIFANTGSLPQSLCHCNRCDALDEAEYLLCALKETVTALFNEYGQKGTEDGYTVMGFLLMLKLIQDKIRIARGDLAFPEARERAPKLEDLLAAGADKLAANNPDKAAPERFPDKE